MFAPFIGPAFWPPYAPSQAPQITVHWEDAAQKDVVVVQGARYRCRIGTLPARILSLELDGQPLLGPAGMTVAHVDPGGVARLPAPVGVRPDWDVWRSQRWLPATDARARMNVWNASPYYYDAHILDIPLLSTAEVAEYARPEPPSLMTLDYSADNGDSRDLNNITLSRAPDRAMRIEATGSDPHMTLSSVDLQGPVRLRLRLRSNQGGGAAVYWAADGGPIEAENVAIFAVAGDNDWHDYDVDLPIQRRITTLRLDPPGETSVTDLSRVEIRSRAGRTMPRPLRGEIILHAQPDRLGLEFKVEGPEGPSPGRILLTLDGSLRSHTVNQRLVLQLGEERSGLAGLAAPGVFQSGAELSMPADGAWLALRPSDGLAPERRMAPDIHPLSRWSVTLTDGAWLGFDEASGLYIADLDRNGGAFSFEPAYQNPTRRMAASFDLTNDAQPREMLVKLHTETGNLEAGVLTDPYGFMLPVPAFVAKNFAGEMEEPDDAAYGDVYFPLRLAPAARATFTVHPLTHGWGIWPLKQVSSIRFFLIYWHCSTGASETTCWCMNWMETLGAVFHIPDFRPMSGPFWPGQPQHDCQHWPGWLQYNGARGRLCYDKTVFESIAPNLARFTMHFRTSDNTARATVQAWEAPQRDEARTMVKLRYDWDMPCAIEGDARRNFRWLNMSFFTGRNASLLWTGPDGQTVRRDLPSSGDVTILGEPMATASPFMGAEGPGDKYNVLTLVRSFRARLGGEDYDRPAFSAAFDGRDASTWLTVDRSDLQLQPGDFIEAEVMLMPHGEPTPLGFKAERERRRYGLAPTQIHVNEGARISDLPPHVRARDEVAALTLKGGHGDLPLIVDGLKGWKLPLLWLGGVWQDHQVHGGDGYQVQPDGAGGYRVIFTLPHREGQTHDIVVTRAECSEEIVAARDRNGYLELEARKIGEWRLKAPAMFAPGVHRLAPDAPTRTFTGRAKLLRQVPLNIEGLTAPTDVHVETWTPGRIRIRVSGTARLTVGGLRPDGRYRLTAGGRSRLARAENGSLSVTMDREGTVELRSQPARPIGGGQTTR